MRHRCVARRLLFAVASVLTLAAIAIAMPNGDGVTVGPFSFTMPAGWERAPEADEKEAGGWLFGYTKDLPEDATAIRVIFLPTTTPYKNEAERTAFLESLRKTLKTKHPGSFRADSMKLAGVDADRLRFVEDGETIYYLLPYNAERVFTILVIAPAPDAPFPAQASALLSTLKLSGPAYKAPRQPGLLDRLSSELDKASKSIEEMMGKLGARQETEAKKPDTKAEPPADSTKTAGRTSDSQTTVVKSDTTTKAKSSSVKAPDTKVLSDVALFIDAKGNATSAKLAASDRVWTPTTVKAPVALDKQGIRLPEAFEFSTLAKAQYAGGAMVALSAMRELAGPLSPEDEAKLEAKWAPYLHMPPEGAEEYLEKLAPILQETLALRTAAATAAAEFDAAWAEAVAAAEWDSEEDVREALAIADQQRAILVAIQTRLAELGGAAERLGAPPDPIKARTEAKRTHAEAVKTLRGLIKPSAPPSGAWVLKRIVRTSVKPSPGAEGVTYDVVLTDTHLHYLARDAHDVPSPEQWLLDVRWDLPPAVIPGGSTQTIKFSFTVHKKPNQISMFWGYGLVGLASDGFLDPNPRARSRVPMYDPVWGFEKGYMLGVVPGGEPPETGTKALSFVAPAGEPGQTVRLTIGANLHPLKDDYTQKSDCKFYRVFEYVWTTDPKEIADAGKGLDEGAEDSGDTGSAGSIAFHEANIRFIERNLERDREELAKETDPSRRAMIEWRILQAESDLVAEQDLIATIQSGRIVHRRTPFDDYAHDRFVQSVRDNQVKIEQFQRATAALQRLARMLPPGEAEEARKFIDRQLSGGAMARMDIATVQKVAHALNEKVQGYAEAERASAKLDEAWAQAKLDTAEELKSAADKGMFACSLFGGRGVMIAYQAATGYIEGGPTEAILRTAAWAGTPAYVASEAFRGYQRTDDQGDPAGWAGAAKDAAKAFVFARLFDYGASKAKQWVTGAKPQGMTVAERQQLQEFRQARAQGERQAVEFTRAQAELERAGSQGASAETLTKLQAECRKAAAAVHANPHAKNYLKFKGDVHSQRAYNAHMRANHAEVEASFHEIMQQRGWNRQPLREFRNAASGDSVGMDYDIGLDEAAASALKHNGQPASVYEWQQDAQKAWDAAYTRVTGQSAGRSWETVTTSVHAESYKDLGWLSRDKSGIQKAWAEQAADVTRYKNWHMLNDPALDRLTALQEVSRGTAKDIGTKLQPLFNAAKPASPQATEALAKSRRHWTRIQTILEAYGNNSMDPITASRRIREVTGGKDIPEVVDEAAAMIESLGKNAGK